MKNLRTKLQQIPKLPGVYLFKDINNNIIYIGKALNLFNRVNSYSTQTNDIKTRVMVKKIEDIEYFVTNNEVEALLLENNLIKKLQPKYNIQLRDAKTYPMLKITKKNLPKIVKCREKINDKHEYYGPFISTQTLKILQKIFTKVLKIRSCNKKFSPPYNYTPCLNYHIGKCSAPCASIISIQDYQKSIDMAREILKGKTKTIMRILKNKMEKLSKNFEYESAAKIRDQIKILENFNLLQYIDTQSKENCDYIGIFSDFKNASISLIQERNGKIIGKENFIITNIIDFSAILLDFLKAYYLNITLFPSTIFIPEDIEKIDLLKNALKIKFNTIVEIKKPNSTKHKKILILAKENAEIFFEEKQYKLEKIHNLRELKKILGLSKLPRIIEGFDIATLNGKYNTASMVSFIDGKPNKSGYRQFNIENKSHPDDYSMMEEVIGRRYQKLRNEKKKLPDLILVDGGKGQVNSAARILSILNLDITIIGLAKKNELIYLQNRVKPIKLPANSSSLKLLQSIRDEAHRFSNRRLNKKYKKKNLESRLLKIKGLGKKRLNTIFIKFGSINSLISSSVNEIAMTEGIGENLAKKIFEYLH